MEVQKRILLSQSGGRVIGHCNNGGGIYLQDKGQTFDEVGNIIDDASSGGEGM